MKGRFQRGGAGGVSPFFAFQDIITSAMAVIITIVMLLALDMGDPLLKNSGGGDSGALARKLEQLLDALAQANATLSDAAEKSAGDDPSAVRGRVEWLRAELAGMPKGPAPAGTVSGAQWSKGGAAILQESLDKTKARIARVTAQIADAEKEAASRRAQVARVEEQLKEKESQLLAEQKKRNELWLIPDRTNTTKEPVLAVVSGGTITLQRLGSAEKQELVGSGLVGKFGDALSRYAKLEQYIVFYFKPSGCFHFDELTNRARSAGFEIGYDAVGEEVSVQLKAP